MPAADALQQTASSAFFPDALPVFAGSHFTSPLPASKQIINLPPDHGGIFQVLDTMVLCVLGKIPPDFSGYLDRWVKDEARRIVFTAGCVTPDDQIKAVFDFVKDEIIYLLHPDNVQIVQDCRRTIESGSGDCVSKSVCLATLLASLGHDVWFVIQCLDGQDYSHVYCETLNQYGQPISLDPVAEHEPMGWRQCLPDGGFETTWRIF